MQGVLGARIDRLPADEKALLQTMAVIGHRCPRQLLMRVLAEPEAEVLQRLINLQASELLYEQPAVPEHMVRFKHILTQEVAYHSLSRERQHVLHERTAQAIEALAGDRLAERHGELAHHYRCSGNTQQAIMYLQRAGQQAADQSAYGEAITHLTQGLALLPNLPDTLERSRHELDLQITLGQVFTATKGQASPEMEHAFTRAHALCAQVGETAQLVTVLRGLSVMYVARGPLSKARELAEQILGLAQGGQDAVRLAGAHDGLGHILFFLGEFASARAHLDKNGSRWYEAELHRLTGEFLLRQEAGGGGSGSPPPEFPTLDGHEDEAIVPPSRQTKAETWFHQALDIARRQQAKSLELRAAVSLSRLWRQQGRRTEAYQLLAPIYGWFTEGFDTADLQDGKALLDALACNE